MEQNKDKRLQEIYMQLQMIGQQTKQADEQIHMVEHQMHKLVNLKENLEELKNLSEKNNMTSLGSGIFVDSKFKNTSEVLVEVGSKIFVKKPISEAQVTIDKQVELSKKYVEQINSSLQMLNQQAATLQNEAETLVK